MHYNGTKLYFIQRLKSSSNNIAGIWSYMALVWASYILVTRDNSLPLHTVIQNINDIQEKKCSTILYHTRTRISWELTCILWVFFGNCTKCWFWVHITTRIYLLMLKNWCDGDLYTTTGTAQEYIYDFQLTF